jgi:hypothetical protein
MMAVEARTALLPTRIESPFTVANSRDIGEKPGKYMDAEKPSQGNSRVGRLDPHLPYPYDGLNGC